MHSDRIEHPCLEVLIVHESALAVWEDEVAIRRRGSEPSPFEQLRSQPLWEGNIRLALLRFGPRAQLRFVDSLRNFQRVPAVREVLKTAPSESKQLSRSYRGAGSDLDGEFVSQSLRGVNDRLILWPLQYRLVWLVADAPAAR